MALQYLNSEQVLNIFNNKSIAIVGNSPSLRGSKQGNQIDSHDIVIRFNDSIIHISEFKDDYGSKTDVWSINGWSSYLDKKYPSIPLDKCVEDTFKTNTLPHSTFLERSKPIILGSRPVIPPSNPLMLQRGLMMRGPMFKLVKDLIPYQLDYIDIPNDIFELEFLGGHFNISSGLATILLILHFNPKKINLFGFNFFNHKEPTHFYEDKFNYTEKNIHNVFSVNNLRGIGHNGKFEKELINKLGENYNIQIN